MTTTTTTSWLKNNKTWRKLDEQMRNTWQNVQKQGKTWEKKLRSARWYKAAIEAQEDMGKRMEKVRDEALHAAGLVTQHDLDALNRKLNALDKRVNNN